jgi:hypothetical protein
MYSRCDKMAKESLKVVEYHNPPFKDEHTNETDVPEFSGWENVINDVYGVDDASKIFSFLSDALRKRDLLDAFSSLIGSPKKISNENIKNKLSKLTLNYGFVELEGDIWRPKVYTPYELTKNLRRIFRRENAPRELIKILNRYTINFLGESERSKKVSEVVFGSELLGLSCFGKIESFLKERGVDSITLESKLESGFLRYSIKSPKLVYGVAEELTHLLEDELLVQYTYILPKAKQR